MDLKITHGKGNARNSEGAFVDLKDGSTLFIYTRYRGCWDDHAVADLAQIIYSPKTKTWSKPKILVRNKAMNVMSVSLLRLQSGAIAFAYLEKTYYKEYDYVDCRPIYRISQDEGKTWSEPVPIPKTPPAYYVIANDRLIQLKSGRILLPTSLYVPSPVPQGIAFCFYSDDDGATWHKSRQTCYPPQWLRSGFAEPGAIERKDGSVMMWFRTNGGCQYKAFSTDGGESWSAPVPAPEFQAPESPMSIKADPATGDWIAVWNDHDPRYGIPYDRGSCGRTPFVMAYSHDEGESWEDHTVLGSDIGHVYCYTAIHFPKKKKGHVLLAYCCGPLDNWLGDCQIELRKLIKK